MAPESTMYVAEVGTEGIWVGFGLLQPTIVAYDNVLMLLSLLSLLKLLCAVPHHQASQTLFSVQLCIVFAWVAPVLWVFSSAILDVMLWSDDISM